MASSRTNPYLPVSSRTKPYLLSSRIDPYLPPVSTNPYGPASTDPCPPASTNEYGPGSMNKRLKLSNNTASHTKRYSPVSEYKKFEGLQRAKGSGGTRPKPFRQTYLGRLPPELREMIYTGLLATPPTFAGRDFIRTSLSPSTSSTAPVNFVHLKASWRQIMQTCRQIYYEAWPIFFASRHYYFASPQEADRSLGYSVISFRPLLRLDTVTAICLSGFVNTIPLYSKERLDNIFSNPNDPRRNSNTRQQLETLKFKTISTNSIWSLRCLKSLRTVSLCFLVGEELLQINMLYGLTDIRRGFVEFVDAKKWLIREQNPEDAWSIQYACFTYGDFNKGKDNEEITYDRRLIEADVTDIDSRAPGLKQGDERFVEVSIRWPVKNSPAQDPLSNDPDDSSWSDTNDDSSVVAVNGDSDDAQLGATHPADTSDESDIEPVSGAAHEIQSEVSSTQAEENVLTENSGHEDTSAEVESNSNVNDESPVLGLNSEDSRDSQESIATHQEGDNALSQPPSEEVPGIESGAQRNLRAELIAVSRTLERLAGLGSMTARDDQSSQLHTSDGHDHIQEGTAPTTVRLTQRIRSTLKTPAPSIMLRPTMCSKTWMSAWEIPLVTPM